MVDVGQEYGATTGRRRRCGWLDLVVLRHAVRVNGITALAALKLDVLTGLDEIHACVSYRAAGKDVRDFPASLSLLEKCEPVYRTFPGWSEPISQVREFEDLPQTAQDYVHWIEDELGVPVALLGVGPERDATIERANPFDKSTRQ
jgi:adenylosuccinate synthase